MVLDQLIDMFNINDLQLCFMPHEEAKWLISSAEIKHQLQSVTDLYIILYLTKKEFKWHC